MLLLSCGPRRITLAARQQREVGRAAACVVLIIHIAQHTAAVEAEGEQRVAWEFISDWWLRAIIDHKQLGDATIYTMAWASSRQQHTHAGLLCRVLLIDPAECG